MVLGVVVGKLGAGKTLYLVHELYYYLILRHYTLFTNFQLDKLPYGKLDKPEELITLGLSQQFHRKFSAIDEGYLWFDALEKSSSKQMFYRNLINITRKMNYIILFSTQSIGQIYYRARLLFDFIVKPEYNKRRDYLKITLLRQNIFGEYIQSTPYKIHKVSRFFEHYNTNEIINDFVKDFVDVDPSNQITLDSWNSKKEIPFMVPAPI